MIINIKGTIIPINSLSQKHHEIIPLGYLKYIVHDSIKYTHAFFFHFEEIFPDRSYSFL